MIERRRASREAGPAARARSAKRSGGLNHHGYPAILP
jgi:hypothetical protein